MNAEERERLQRVVEYADQVANWQIEQDGWIREGDSDINAGAFAQIELMGSGAWLGNINLYAPDRMQIMWQPGEHEDLTTFCAAFVIPAFDQELHDMIKARHEAEYTGTKADYARVNAITERVAAIGGYMLLWS